MEAGIKNEFLERTLRVNAAYFYLSREGSQFSSIIQLDYGQLGASSGYGQRTLQRPNASANAPAFLFLH